MKLRLTITIFSFIIISGCGILSKSFDDSLTPAFTFIVPDSCDISLIKNITTYRSNRKEFPDYSSIVNFKNSLTQNCQAIYDSINIFPFGVDSIDLLLIKKLNLQNSNASGSKYYRIVFQDDSIKTIKEFIKTSNSSKRENKKNKNSFRIEWD